MPSAGLRQARMWLAATSVGVVTVVAAATPAHSATVASSGQPVALAAPYEYLGWGDPQPPADVVATTGIHDLTLAFVLAHKGCHPEWDGSRPLLGGSDASAIAAVRAAGGDVGVSVGGWSGTKLGAACKSAAALTAAYQQVVSAYGLSALDIDIEHTEFTKAVVRTRVIAALAALQQQDPTLEISVTFGTGETGPDADGRSMIQQAASLGFHPYAWTIMPFDFGAPVSDMGTVSVQAAEGLADTVAADDGVPLSQAFAEVGISSMNGQTDESDETVSESDFQEMLTFARSEHLARLTFWAVNRDRPCGNGLTTGAGSCSGISQAPDAFTDLLSGYTG
jgi:hypothetical protein